MATKKTQKMTKKVGPITLGEEYTDMVHNRTGIAVCYATHLTGCNRVCVEWKDKDGEIKDMWVDETRLKGVTLDEVQDGPGQDPPRRGIR